MTAQLDVWQDGFFSKDEWKAESLDVKTVLLSDWKDEEQDWAAYNGKLAIVLEPGDSVADIADELDRFDMVAVSFPAFSDGRGFSQARQLRDTFSYKGDIRAKGAYILDQMPMLQRCGVSSFEVTSAAVRKGLEEKLLPGIAYQYQHALGTSVDADDDQKGRAWTRFGVSSLEINQSEAERQVA